MLSGQFHWQSHVRECFECTRRLSQALSYSATPHWTEQFQSVSVGLGALLAGLGGSKIGLDWLQQVRLRRKVLRLMQRYPIDALNKDYELVDTKNVPGKW